MQLPKLVAHRGWARNYPENTLVALEAAMKVGAPFVEIDVQLSSDGYPVLFHDRDLQRMCGVRGAVHELTLAELRALSCGEAGRFGAKFASEGIASLAGFVQLLRRHPGVHAFVEIKRAATERFGDERVLERVLGAIEPAATQVALISFSLPFLAAARASSSLPLGAVFDAWSERGQSAVAALAPEYVFCDVDGLPKRGALEHARATIVVYEVADAALAASLRARGVHMVETFEIGEMLAAFRLLEAAGP
jgi:glycerophosphoryl diester phosphodiesterase